MQNDSLVLIVTGASAGIGRGIVLEAIKNGARVIGCSRTEEKLKALKNEVLHQGYSADVFNYVAGDTADKDVTTATIEKAIELYGHIDVLVNNAGDYFSDTSLSGPIAKTNLDDFTSVNVFATLFWTQTALPHLKKVNGKVINISSVNSVHPTQNNAALNMLTAVLAEEEKDIQTIAICPGPVYTEALERLFASPDATPQIKERREKYTIEELRKNIFEPEDTGYFIWRLITNFPTEFNGKFVPHSEPSLAKYHRKQ
ncbi:4081_t:CDS:2, partial [Scutellospora calospora]